MSQISILATKRSILEMKSTLLAQTIECLILILAIADLVSKPEYAVVHVDLQSVGLSLTVRLTCSSRHRMKQGEHTA